MDKEAFIESTGIKGEIIPSAIFAIVAGIIGYIVSLRFHLDENIRTIIVGTSVLIGSLIVIFVFQRARKISDERNSRYMQQNTGILRVFDNLEICEQEMKDDFRQCKQAKMLLQMGRREFGDRKGSWFWTIAQERQKVDKEIKILRASQKSPYFSEQRAISRGKSYERWQTDLNRLKVEIYSLRKEYHVNIQDVPHKEPFLWRIFIFDDYAYISGYLYESKNDNYAKVYKMIRGEESLFTIFEKYFDYLWEKYQNEQE